MRSVTITPEEIDVDVCFGEFDGFTTKTTWVVDMFKGKTRVDSVCMKTEQFAKETADKFIRLGLCAFGYC